MRAVLTGLSGRGPRTNSPMRSRLAAISLGHKQPKTRLESWYKKAGPINIPENSHFIWPSFRGARQPSRKLAIAQIEHA